MSVLWSGPGSWKTFVPIFRANYFSMITGASGAHLINQCILETNMIEITLVSKKSYFICSAKAW